VNERRGMAANGAGRGFTLVELAMVLFVLALILGGILGPLSVRMEGEERKQTGRILDEIRDSLIGYALVNGHLPCPDCRDTGGSCGSVSLTVNDGIEDGVDSGAGISPRAGNTFDTCASQEGNLPWVTLGVPEFDAWGNRFGYRVAAAFADDPDGTGAAGCLVTAGVSFQICSAGDIRVEDGAGNTVAQNLPALAISYGKNADEPGNPSSSLETENQDDDTTFVDAVYSKETAIQFDDVLIWVPVNNLIYRMVQAERLP